MAGARGFRRVTSDLYVRSHGNLVRRQSAATSRVLVWIPFVDGSRLPGQEFEKRANAELAVLAEIEKQDA